MTRVIDAFHDHLNKQNADIQFTKEIEENGKLPFLWLFGEAATTGTLSKPRRRRQRERHQTKGLMSKTIAVHVRYNSLYISMASSA